MMRRVFISTHSWAWSTVLPLYALRGFPIPQSATTSTGPSSSYLHPTTSYWFTTLWELGMTSSQAGLPRYLYDPILYKRTNFRHLGLTSTARRRFFRIESVVMWWNATYSISRKLVLNAPSIATLPNFLHALLQKTTKLVFSSAIPILG